MQILYTHLKDQWKRLRLYLIILYILYAILLLLQSGRLDSSVNYTRHFVEPNTFVMIDYSPYFYYLLIGLSFACILYLVLAINSYRQGKTRWLLLMRHQTTFLLGDLLFLFLTLCILYLISYVILYFDYTGYVKELSAAGASFAQEQKTFTAMLENTQGLALLYRNVLFTILYLFTISLGCISFLSIMRTIKQNRGYIFILVSSLLIVPYIILQDTYILTLVILLCYNLSFLYIIKHTCTRKEIGG